jgi:hypothetical protein
LVAVLAAALVVGAVLAAVVWMFTAGSGGSDQALVGRANVVAAVAGLLALLAVLGGVFRWAAQSRPAAPAGPQLDVSPPSNDDIIDPSAMLGGIGRMTGRRVFVSYVRDDSKVVDWLVLALEAYGLDVWTDRKKLKAGMRWKSEIRRAIDGGDYFIACFSKAYTHRTQTYMNEELIIAIERLRQMPRDRRWFIPVLLESTAIPDYQIGPGEMLADLQHIDLSTDRVAAVRKLADDLQGRVGHDAAGPQINQVISRIARAHSLWRIDPSYNYFGEPEFTALRREVDAVGARSHLNDDDYQWLLLGALYDGNIPTSLLPSLDDPSILGATGYWLRRRNPRGPRYRSASLLERCTVPGRDEAVERALANSGFATAQELAAAIRQGTVAAFIEDPQLSYDLDPAVPWDRQQRQYMLDFWERLRDYYEPTSRPI